jgi:sugar phosphate isomerase/epimerase
MTDVSYSTAGFTDRTLERALTAIAEAGFTTVEIASQPAHLSEPHTGDALAALRRHLDACGLRVGTVHAPMRENVLGAPEEGWRRDKVGVLSAYLHCAADLGAGGLVIHPVPNPIFVPDAEHPELPGLIAAAVRCSIEDLVPAAQAAGVRMLLENLPYHCDYPFLDMTGLRRLVDDYPEDAIGLVVDTGHAWTTAHDPVVEIRAAAERLHGTHLQDVDAEDPQDNHWVPGEGGLHWAAIGDALRTIGYDDMWTFEAMYGRHEEAPEQVAAMTQRFSTTWP